MTANDFWALRTHRAWVAAALLGLIAALLGSFVASGAAPAAAGSVASVRSAAVRNVPSRSPRDNAKAVAEARAINLQLGDLPKGQKWAGSPQPGSTKVTAAAGRTAAKCLDRLGAKSADPFGTSHSLGGNVLADVLSPQFAPKGGIGLPGANSEVVVVAAPGVATADLAAIAKKGSLACLSAQYLVDTEASGSGKAHVTASFEKAPRHGSGNGGVHITLLEKGGSLPLTLYNDEYFYAEGNAEVVFSFLDLGSAFSSSAATATVAKVMARAAKLAR